MGAPGMAPRQPAGRGYLARFVIDGETILAAFELGGDGWSGITQRDEAGATEAMRLGVRLYRRQ